MDIIKDGMNGTVGANGDGAPSSPDLSPPDLSQVMPLVVDALAEALGEKDDGLLGITEHTRLGADLDLVSLHLVYLSAALEDRFPIRLDPTSLFDPEAPPAEVTVGELAARIAAVLAEPSGDGSR